MGRASWRYALVGGKDEDNVFATLEGA